MVWPTIKGWCRGGELVPVESVTSNDFASQLDMLSGIDAWQVAEGLAGMRGIASRVQYGTSYDSFTVRTTLPSGADTELQKRQAALADPDAGWLYPALTVQAYVKDGTLLTAAMVRTKDLIPLATQRLADGYQRPSPTRELFTWVPWEMFTAKQIHVYPPGLIAQ